ncbi:MAG: bile acid:sodium symporter [Planctomycetes bacterium]|nr:bile acid:sodium symporter [Planctomycetota bacterium]
MLAFLRKRWFLIGLVVLISVGLGLGLRDPAMGHRIRTELFRPRVIVMIVLFLMAFSLDSRQLGRSLRRPAPVLWASAVNYGIVPLLAWGTMRFQTVPDFAFGVMIAGSVPCTLAAASVWTRKAGGNDAVSLFATLTTNSLCFLITPFWLNLTTAQGVELDANEMVMRLLQAVLLPTLLGQSLRQIPSLGRLATIYKTPIGVVAQCFVLSLVFMASWNAGTYLHDNAEGPGWGGVILVWLTVMAIHLAAMLIAVAGSLLFGFDPRDRAAVAFAGSQKTLPIGVYLATDPKIFGDPNLLGPGLGVPFAIFPMLMYHASQLFIDTVVADWMAARLQRASEAHNRRALDLAGSAGEQATPEKSQTGSL